MRELSALPAAHTAGIITMNQALCNGYQLLCLSAQGGEFRHSGEAILDAIERWRPTGVFGFAVTWAELARYDLAARDLSSVRNWSSTGDCAHESHIRRLVAVGSHLTYQRGEGVVSVPGSKFIDNLGSTEMGHSAFYMTHRLGSDRYGRCVGKPYPFAEVVAARRRDRRGGAGRRGRPLRAEVADPGAGLLERLGEHLPHQAERLLPDR